MNSKQIQHDPIRPVRADVVGEVVMVERWQALMRHPVPLAWDHDEPACLLYHILSCELTPRAAAVAASFIRWTGTNCGRAFLEKGMAMTLAHGEDGYLLAWSLENRRYQGSRTIEHVLAGEENLSAPAGVWGRGLSSAPQVDDKDCEAIESLCSWFGTRQGKEYLEGCEAKIQQRVREDRQARLEAYKQRLAATA
jgi:hypothetical protein